MRRVIVLAVLLPVLLVAASQALAAPGTTTSPQTVNPATGVYMEQIPTAKGDANANGAQPSSDSTTSGGGSTAIVLGVVIALLGAGAVLVVLRRRGATPRRA